METLNNIHPGEVLLEEFLKPLGISQNRLARARAAIMACRYSAKSWPRLTRSKV